MIERIRIRNFKSIGELILNVGHFTCLIGMNGTGKSTILQAIDFMSQVLSGNIVDWMQIRGWSVQDLNCRVRKESNIGLGLRFRTASNQKLVWGASFNRHEMRCSTERITLDNDVIFSSKDQTYLIEGEKRQAIPFVYQGSVLSQLKDTELPTAINDFRNYMQRLRSLELLSPHLLRKAGRTEDKDIGSGGEKLSGYLHTIKSRKRDALLGLLKKFYPNVVDYRVASIRAGWKKLYVIEEFDGRKLETEATHLSDGLLRIFAVLAQAQSDRSLVLLDEIENGINPEIIERLVELLVDSPQQLLVTTHSPMILNYLEDEVAREAVQFVYKSPEGETRVRPFFSLQSIGAKLESMGPGEAFVDTDMIALTKKCVKLDAKETVEKETLRKNEIEGDS